jgi:putative membrane protein
MQSSTIKRPSEPSQSRPAYLTWVKVHHWPSDQIMQCTFAGLAPHHGPIVGGDLAMWLKISAFLVPIAVSLAQPLLVMAQQTAEPGAPQPQWPHGHGHWHAWGDHSSWHFWWTPLMMIFFIFLFIGAMRYFRFDRRWDHMMHRSPRDPSFSAIEILNERFARGEIDEDEYKDKKAKILSA